ncbi:MAG: amidohydrolase, partial [Acidobacteria bacterium]|nr:amidohydrolase [Acidobacteriota bacterium]
MIRKIIVSLLVSLFIFPLAVPAQAKRPATLLLYNGKIFSADEKGTIFQAVVIDGEKIVAVGNTGQLREKYNAAREIDLKGKLVTPGFNDAHI